MTFRRLKVVSFTAIILLVLQSAALWFVWEEGQNQVSELEQRLASAHEEASSHEDRIEQLESQVDDLQDELSDARLSLREKEDRIEELEEQVADYRRAFVGTFSSSPASPYVAPDPATARQLTRSLFAEYLEREPESGELEHMTDAYMEIHRQAHREGGNVNARFREYFLDRYSAEIDRMRSHREIQENRERFNRSMTCSDAQVSGERQPDYCH